MNTRKPSIDSGSLPPYLLCLIFRSEDDEDEGEDYLNEALAELSPVNTDDEEDVSNADDLLLEIEEMINS